jgi:excisionase family DNA binding protein
MSVSSSARKGHGTGDSMISPADRKSAEDLLELLGAGGGGHFTVHGIGGKTVDLSPSLAMVIERAAALVATGAEVAMLPQEEELTSQQAADLVGVSRQYLVRLLERGDIPSAKIGKHRRVRAGDLAAYCLRRDEGRRAALAAITEQAQLDGGYETPAQFGPRRKH